MKTSAAMCAELEKQEHKASRAGTLTPTQPITQILNALVTRPERIEPLEPLAGISPAFASVTVEEMRSLLLHLAEAQSYAERGVDTTRWHKVMQGWAGNTRRNLELSDEQAAMLIATPLERLVKPGCGQAASSAPAPSQAP